MLCLFVVFANKVSPLHNDSGPTEAIKNHIKRKLGTTLASHIWSFSCTFCQAILFFSPSYLVFWCINFVTLLYIDWFSYKMSHPQFCLLDDLKCIHYHEELGFYCDREKLFFNLFRMNRLNMISDE